jgi:5-methylcytosine-specific restriction enzyme A
MIRRYTMTFNPGIEIGSIVNNEKIMQEFKCSNSGGMRRSIRTNTLIIVSDKTKGLYEDKWYGDILHYTGMGMSGDQNINYMQNKTLAESKTNGVDVHLFEVLVPGKYVYWGQIDLCETPYQEEQKGDDNEIRKVWMFPVKPRSETLTIAEDMILEYEIKKEKRVRKLSTNELKQRANKSRSEKTAYRTAITTSYIRDPFVSAYAKRRANGICTLCEEPAPFNNMDREPYLETHHIVWLSDGGSDTIENTTALCPNCHRKMHVLNLQHDVQKLRGLIINDALD